jgi:hypothetical protein
MAAFFSAILGFFNAIPIFANILEMFVKWYVEKQYADMRQENRDAIKRAINEHDQRDAEKMLGNPNVGVPTGIGVIRDGPPRVRDSG